MIPAHIAEEIFGAVSNANSLTLMPTMNAERSLQNELWVKKGQISATTLSLGDQPKEK